MLCIYRSGNCTKIGKLSPYNPFIFDIYIYIQYNLYLSSKPNYYSLTIKKFMATFNTILNLYRVLFVIKKN